MIDLGYTGMGMKGMMGIYSALMESPAAEVIESLKLDAPTFNGPSEHATRHLAQAIKSCRNLKELSLRAFHLDDIELSYLVKNAFAPKMGLVSLVIALPAIS